MSSAATLTYEEAIRLAEWEAFCADHSIAHAPEQVGGGIFRCGEVEITFGDADQGVGQLPESAGEIRFSTFWMGEALPEVARLAVAAWQRWGGCLKADPEVRSAIDARVPSGTSS